MPRPSTLCNHNKPILLYFLSFTLFWTHLSSSPLLYFPASILPVLAFCQHCFNRKHRGFRGDCGKGVTVNQYLTFVLPFVVVDSRNPSLHSLHTCSSCTLCPISLCFLWFMWLHTPPSLSPSPTVCSPSIILSVFLPNISLLHPSGSGGLTVPCHFCSRFSHRAHY